MNKDFNDWKTISWIFATLFFAIGMLNIIFIHVIPGFFYFVLAILFTPYTNVFLNKKLGFFIPPLIKLIIGILVLWATLGVGDLMEMFESWFMA